VIGGAGKVTVDNPSCIVLLELIIQHVYFCE